MENQREFERFDLKVPAMVGIVGGEGSEEEMSLFTDNICAGGAYLAKATDKPLSKGTKIQMSFVLNIAKLKELLDSDCQVRVSGEVVRSDEEGIAVRFDSEYKLTSIKGTVH